MGKKILITAFEPFGGMPVNTSQEVLSLLPREINGVELYKQILPVSHEAAEIAGSALCRVAPDAALSLGLAAGDTCVRVERIAVNIADYGIPDNAGLMPEGGKIIPSGPAAYFLNSDPGVLLKAIESSGTPAYISNHAGTYVCNYLMYSLSDLISERYPLVKYGFIHLPVCTEALLGQEGGRKKTPSLPIKMLEAAVEAAAAALAG